MDKAAKKWLSAALIGAMLGLSCRRKQDAPTAVVVICDLSASIDPEARVAMFRSVESLASTLRRGDSLAVIPLTGDTENESSGRVLRIEISAKREVYDEDLRRDAAEARKSLEQMAEWAMNSPSGQTDLLGALAVAREELSGVHRNHRSFVIVLSDFIQDDARFNFEKDPKLADPAIAKALAAELAAREGKPLEGVRVFLGYLKSHDLGALGRDRRAAIRAFWVEYIKRLGAAPWCVADGPGLVLRFLAEARASQAAF